MILSTTIVTVLAFLGVLFGAATRFDVLKSRFESFGLSAVASMSNNSRMLLGTLTSLSGGTLVAIWAWVIQRQSVIGNSSLCAESSGCARALADSSVNIIPFTNMGYGQFYILLFSVLGFFALSVYLDPKWKGGGRFLSIGGIIAIIGTVVSMIMLVTQVAFTDGGPVLCLLCLILVASNTVTLTLFHQLNDAWVNNTFDK